MSTTFADFISRVLSAEGGYVNDPRDPGGETQWGISKRAYPNVNIRALTRQNAIDIYYRDFWVASKANQLAPALAFQMLDAAVNHGVGQAERWLQRAVGVADDGVIGPLTLAAVAKKDLADTILLFNAQRLDFYAALSKGNIYWRGWIRRVAADLRFAAGDTP